MTKTSMHLMALLIGASLSMAAHAMQFELRPVTGASPARAALVMSGKVDRTKLRQLKDWLEKQPEIDTIILKNSTGGDAAAGYAVGEYIRDKGLATGVAGHCLSSCSRMFLGGKTRFFTDELPPEKTMIGFHGNYRADGRLFTERLYTLKHWVMKYMDWNDGKRSKYEPLVDQWSTPVTTMGLWISLMKPSSRLRTAHRLSTARAVNHGSSGLQYVSASGMLLRER